MCLKVKDLNPIIADKPIIGYKVLIQKGSSCFTGYRHVWAFKEMKARQYYKDNLPWFFTKDQLYHIESQGVHLFKTKEDAKEAISHMKLAKETEFWRIVEATIPFGTEYWEGTFDMFTGDNDTHIASFKKVPAYAATIIELDI